MAPTKFINFLAVLSFAVFYISLTPITANALAVERAHVARNLNYAHAGIARKKRDGSAKRCKPRPAHNGTHHGDVSKPHTTPPPPHHSSSPTPHPAPTTSSSSHEHAPAVTPEVHTSSKSGVVGLAWSNNEQSAICKFKTSHTGLVYNWKIHKYTDVDVSKCGFEFIPQVWGADQARQVPETLVAGYATKVLSFNEPELGSQSNLGVDQAVQLFMQYINPLQHLGYEIIGPSCTNSPDGVKWVRSFVTQVRKQGGKIDAVSTHYYGVSSSDFIQFMDGFIAAFPGDPIYLTEFAAQDYSGKNQQLSLSEIQTFLETTTGYLRGKSEVLAYFWFGAMTPDELAANKVNGLNSLMNGNASPNPLGEAYLNP